jgi:acetylornithine deacetylase
LLLQSVIEDECTGNGTLALVARGYDAEAAIVVDGTGPGRAIVNHPGQLAFHVTIYGKPAPWGAAHRAVNAIEKSAVIVAALRRLEAEKNGPVHPLWSAIEHPVNLNFFGIRGGEWLGTVAARCVCDFGLTFLPPDTLESTRATIERVVAEAAAADPWLRDHPPSVGYNALATPPVLADPASRLFQTLDQNHRAVFGTPLAPATITGWCDVRHFSLRRPAQALLFGPGGGGGAHCPDEWLNLDDLLPVTRTLLGATIDWLGAERA